MSFAARRAPAYSLASLALVTLAALVEGCGGPSSSREQEYAKSNARAPEKVPVGKFSGRVTVDGVTQVGPDGLFVFLTDPQHLEKPNKYLAHCKNDGTFEFTTNFPGDGVPLGKYVVGFVALQAVRKARGGMPADGPLPYREPDSLKNLYNDPDKNKDIQEFVVDVTEPGRADYEFNLTVAGKDPGVPGPHALKALVNAPGDF
jgi:hypothetical protein